MNFRVGSPMVVLHGKPWRAGRQVLMRGEVASIEGDRLTMARRFRSPGMAYDGLEGPRQEPGDHGLVELARGGWISKRRYLRRDGRPIGDLYNVQTPTELRPRVARYVDLEIDVAVLPRVVVQDEAELEAGIAGGHIPAELGEVACGLAYALAERLKDDPEADWDLRPEETKLSPAVQAALGRWSAWLASVPYTR